MLISGSKPPIVVSEVFMLARCARTSALPSTSRVDSAVNAKKGPDRGSWTEFSVRKWYLDQISKAFRLGDPRSPSLKLVVLAETKIITRSSGDAPSARAASSRPATGRRRITESLRQQVIQCYTRENMGAQAVGDELGLAKSTVLRILKQGDIDIRPQGVRIT